MYDYNGYSIKITENIQNFIDRVTPIFEHMTTLSQVSEGLNLLHTVYDKGRNAIRRSSGYAALTDEEKENLLYTFDLYFTDVFDIALNQRIYIEYQSRKKA